MPFEGVKVAPPPARNTAARPAPDKKRVSGKQALREEAANGIGQIIAFGSMVMGNFADAGAIGMHWPNMAHEAAVAAETDQKLAAGLDWFLEVGPYGKLVTVSLPLVAQVLVNHGFLKAEQMAGAGVVHPETLAAQVRTDLARKAMAAIREQQEAEAEMQRMQEEMSTQNGNGPTQ